MEKYIEIDNQILSNNVKNIVSNTEYDYYIGIVKANAYGHGYDIVNILIEAGVNYLAVISLEEAIEVRKRNKNIPILVLSPIDLEDIELIKEYNVTLTVSNIDYFKELIELDNEGIKVHIKIDTGLNRLGFKNKDEIDFVYNYLLNNDNLILEGLFTHLSSSYYPDQKYYDQIEEFKELTRDIDYNNIPIIHIFKSNPVYYLDKLPFCNAVRLGILMYGVMPEAEKVLNETEENFNTNRIDVETAFKLISKVVEVKKVTKDSYVGYNNKYQLEEDAYIAVVPVGYSDGLHLTNDGNYVLINDKKDRTVGGVNMNAITILVDETVHVGDKVVIIDNIYDYMKHNNIAPQMVYGMLDNSIPKKYINI